MLVIVCVTGCHASSEPGKIDITMGVSTDQGHDLGTGANLDVRRSNLALNGDIVDNAKRALLNVFGVTVTAADTVKLFSGAVAFL